MKEEITKYTCDNCKRVEVIGNDTLYEFTNIHSKWIRMYILLKPKDAEKTKLHFCGSLCATDYLMYRLS